jgi:hypothetical protein
MAVCALLSLLGGWHALGRRFGSSDDLDGERFRFRSGAVGRGIFPVAYDHCLFATVGRRALALSVLVPFRLLHPPLVIPYSEVERCDEIRFWFVRHVALHVRGFGRRRVLLRGALGRAVLAAWTQARTPH